MNFALLTIILYAGLLSALSRLFIRKRYAGLENQYKPNKRYPMCTVFTLVALTVCMFIFKKDITLSNLPNLLRWVTAIIFSLCLLETDIREHIIPNKCVVAMFIVSLLLTLANIPVCNRNILSEFISVGAGILTGGGVLLLAAIISKKGIGMGDVKMYAALGALIGFDSIIETMIFSFICGGIFSVFLLCFKHYDKTAKLPMAPFAFIGVIIEFILNIVYMGG